jgi:hypothetical protein
MAVSPFISTEWLFTRPVVAVRNPFGTAVARFEAEAADGAPWREKESEEDKWENGSRNMIVSGTTLRGDIPTGERIGLPGARFVTGIRAGTIE